MDNIYQRLGLPNGCSIEKLEKRMKEYKSFFERNSDIKSAEMFKRVEEEYYELIKDKEAYDKARGFNVSERQVRPNIIIEGKRQVEPDIIIKGKRENYDERYAEMNDVLLNSTNNVIPLNNYSMKSKSYKVSEVDKESRKKKRTKDLNFKKMIPKFVAFGCVLVFSTGIINVIHNAKAKNMENNVCLEYKVQVGDTYSKLSDVFKDYGIVYREVTGPYRDLDFIYAGDIVIGRTTKEVAEKLVSEGYARIISIEEAVEKLEESDALYGEFSKYADDKSDIVFFEPTNKFMM